jgi:hypothetical protein
MVSQLAPDGILTNWYRCEKLRKVAIGRRPSDCVRILTDENPTDLGTFLEASQKYPEEHQKMVLTISHWIGQHPKMFENLQDQYDSDDG